MNTSRTLASTTRKASDPAQILKKIPAFLASNLFFRVIIGLSILQGFWYAISFRPHIFDEPIHLGFINLYANRLNPFISYQPTSWDFLGAVARNESYLFYYLMSWPLRLIGLFTSSEVLKVVILRIINVAIFALALVVYRRVFVKAGVPRVITHLTLLFLILTPSVALLNGAVSYDNTIFLLTAVTLWLATTLLQNKRVDAKQLFLFLALGLFGSLIKLEFLALFLAASLLVGHKLWSTHRRHLPARFLRSFRRLSRTAKIALIVTLTLAVGLFIERPVMNLVRYHHITPDCTLLLSAERCIQNYTVRRDVEAKASKSADFSPINPFNYTLQEWIPGMITTQTIVPPSQLSSPILRFIYYVSALFGGLLIVYYLRDFLKKPAYKLMLWTMGFYTLALLIYDYYSYVSLGQPVAITGRYLLPIMPIFILFVGLSVIKLVGSSRKILLTLLIGSLLIFSQGGGITTYLLSAGADQYWLGGAINGTNTFLKNHLKTFVRLRKVN